MRILYWTESFWPQFGGVEIISLEFLPAMRERGYEFAVVTSHHDYKLPDESLYNDIPVHRFHFLTSMVDRNFSQLKDALQKVAGLKRAFRPDLVHINTVHHSIFFHQHSARAHPAPTLFAVHGLPESSSGQDTILGRVLRDADWVVAVSGAILDNVRRLVPEVAPRSSRIYFGMDMPAIEPAPLPFDEPHLMCIGRVVADKGFDLALTSFAELASRYPRARLTVAGDGPARDDLERQAASLGIMDAVEFTGWVAPLKVFDLINRAAVVVAPSRCPEAFCLVALQAAQMARPVVATNVGGLPEVVVHGQTGLLVEKENVSQLTEALTFLVENPDTAKQMGARARARAREVFSLESFADAYDELYARLLRENKK